MFVLGVPWSCRFAIYTTCNGMAFVAAWMYRLAIGWIIWELTHSGLWLGLLAICDLGPALIFGPLGGAWADRGRLERVIGWAQGAVVLNSLFMGVAAWAGAPPWVLLVFALTGGAAVATADSPRAAIVTLLVAKKQVGPAVALTAVVINVARFVGPALAGLIATTTELLWVFPLAALMGVPLLLFSVIARIEGRVAGDPVRSVRHNIADGYFYARRHPLIGIVLLNFLIAGLFARGAYELVPGLVDQLFDRNVGGLAAMTTAIGLGAMGAGLLLMGSRSSQNAANASFAGAVLGGVAAVAMALLPSFSGALAASALLGFAISMCGIASQIVVQIEARHDMRNRALSLWAVIIRVAPAIGSLAIGLAADRLGFRIPLGVAGLLGVVLAATGWRMFRRLPHGRAASSAAGIQN